MANTGAPWNIPYVEPSDIVRDYPAADEAQADAIAAGLSAAGSAGIGSNVVSTFKDDTFTTSSTTFTVITGLTATITPTSATSKILVIANVYGSQDVGANRMFLRLMRASTPIGVGGAEGSRAQISGQILVANSTVFVSAAPMVFLDSPATTSATEYSVQIRSSSATVFINRSEGDPDDDNTPRAASSITVIEVAA